MSETEFLILYDIDSRVNLSRRVFDFKEDIEKGQNLYQRH